MQWTKGEAYLISVLKIRKKSGGFFDSVGILVGVIDQLKGFR